MRLGASIRTWRTRNRIVLVALVAIAVALAVVFLRSGERKGTRYWFDDHTYHFEALRALQYAPFKAADANEVLTAIANTTEGDNESWYRSWYQMAQIVERMAGSYREKSDQAYALLRAHNYYRTAEYFLRGDDPRRKDTWQRQIGHFEQALTLLGVRRETFRIPYQGKQLKAVFYPAEGDLNLSKPLIVGITGWDGTIEEKYFTLVPAATRRGYNVLVYEGPGQGSVLREQGLLFTHQWHQPNSAVLDYFVGRYGKPGKIVLVGTSLGAILAMQAAAKDRRIDGVVAYDVMFDALQIGTAHVPGPVTWLYRNGHRNVLNFLLRQSAKVDPMIAWGLDHSRWTMGIQDETGSLDALRNYHLRDAIGEITCDVLLMEGALDHFLMVSDQRGQAKSGLKNARSVSESRLHQRLRGMSSSAQPFVGIEG